MGGYGIPDSDQGEHVMSSYPAHHDQLVALKRIEGQLRGIQKMITDGKYCVDILTQLHAAVGAILRVEDAVLSKHFGGCVVHAFDGKSRAKKQEKINEIMGLLKKFRRS